MSALDVMRRVLTAYETHDLLGMEAHMQELRGAIAELEKQEPVAWKNAALRLGEELSSVGPDGYYDMTAEQWLDWAMDQQPRGKHSLPTPPRIECTRCGRILADVPPAPAGDTFAARWRNVTGAIKDLL